MFVILLNYKKPLEIVDQFLERHRNFLQIGYEKNFLMASGPQIPRTGGVILSQLNDKQQLEAFLQQDPFYVNEVAEYTIVEFTPVKYHQNFVSFLSE